MRDFRLTLFVRLPVSPSRRVAEAAVIEDLTAAGSRSLPRDVVLSER